MHSANSTSRAEILRPADTKQSLVYDGTTITDRGEQLSLTDMWKAAGSTPNQDPAQWMRSAAGEAFVDAVSVNMGIAHIDLVHTVRGGKTPGTWAHWQVAFAYAKYLSPDFHIWCNQVVREKMEAKAFERSHGLTAGDKSAIGGIVKNVIRDQVEALLPALVDAEVARQMQQQNLLVRRGQTAKQIWDGHSLPARIRGTTVWLGNRLAEMSCAIESNGRADRGNGTVRLFDPDKSAICMRNGLLQRAQAYVAERLGQGRLRLVGGAK